MPETENSSFSILVYGDSLGLPRVASKIGCEHTYAELIRGWYETSDLKPKVFLFNRSQGGADIQTLFNGFNTDSTYFGKAKWILIVQCGIVDCAPRPIPPWVKYRIVARLPGPLRDRIISFLHNNRAKIFRLGLKWYSTSPEKFKTIYAKWLSLAAKEFDRVYAVNIFPTTEKIERHSPGLTVSIDYYNSLIQEAVAAVDAENIIFIDANDKVRRSNRIEDFIDEEDGHHLTKEGHRLLNELIIHHEQSFLRMENDRIKV